MSTLPPDYAVLSKSLDEIEIIIGEALLTDDFGSKEPSDAEKRAVARRWFEQNIGRFRSLICGSEQFAGVMFGPEKKDRNAVLGALVDILGSSFGMLPVAALSAMIIHYGVDKLCPAVAANEN